MYFHPSDAAELTPRVSQAGAAHDFDQILNEHRALMRAHGQAQARCSEQLRAQAREIDRLNAQSMRLRAALIVRDTALAWAREDRAQLERAIPGLPRRVALARHVDALLARVQDLMRERSHRVRADRCAAPAKPPPDDAAALEASLGAADLVICQAGCLSHGDYWRVQNHCKRTGKACVLVEAPEALRIMRIHRSPGGRGAAHIATEPMTAQGAPQGEGA